MGTRAEALAAQLEQANNAVISTVEGLPDAKWRADCANEGRTVGVMAHHIASGHPVLSGFANMIANGEPLPPLTMEMVDQANAQFAAENADRTKDEALALLRSNGEAAANLVRGLSDEQLDRGATMFGAPWTTQSLIEAFLIGHPIGHNASIQAS